MKTVGIAYNDLIPEALDLAHAIVGELNLGSDTWILRAEDAEDLSRRAKGTDLVITIGGDGTILRVNRAIAPQGIPLLGINMGRLGFMTELTVPGVMEQLPRYLNEDMRVSEHSMLMAAVFRQGAGEDSVPEGPYHALNDVVLSRSRVSRVIHRARRDRRRRRVHLPRRRGDTGDGHRQHRVQLRRRRPHRGPPVRRRGADSVSIARGLNYPAGVAPHQQRRFSPGRLAGGDNQRGRVREPPHRAGRLGSHHPQPAPRQVPPRANDHNYFWATLTRRLGFSLTGR